MSRTDKDVPYRVHVVREGVERHDHRFGECDFEPRFWSRSEWARLDTRGWRYRQPCGLEQPVSRYSWTLRYYPRNEAVKFYAREFYDRDSARVQKEVRDIIKRYRAGDDVSDADIADRPHRHSAQWEAW